MILCSFSWISARLTVASGRGRETRDAIAIGSVSRTILPLGMNRVSMGTEP